MLYKKTDLRFKVLCKKIQQNSWIYSKSFFLILEKPIADRRNLFPLPGGCNCCTYPYQKIPKALVIIPDWGRGISGKTPGWEQVLYKKFSKSLEEFRAGKWGLFGKTPGMQTDAQTDSKGFCENSGLGKGNIRENSKLHKGKHILGWEEFGRWHSGREPGNVLGLFYSVRRDEKLWKVQACLC